MKTNNLKSRKTKVKNSTDESTESQLKRKLLALQGKVQWEGNLDEMRNYKFNLGKNEFFVAEEGEQEKE